MTRNLLVFAVVPACATLFLTALPVPVSGQELHGVVGGVARDSASKQPLAQVRITAHNVNAGTDRTAVSAFDGTFTMPGASRTRWVRQINSYRRGGGAWDSPARIPDGGRQAPSSGGQDISRGA